MKFDVVIGNPPYNDEAKQQIYTDFYIQGRVISNQVCLIFPTGWQDPKNANSLRKMNSEAIKRDEQIVHINNVQNVFKGVPGAEWTNIILWKKNYNNGFNGKQRILINGVESQIKNLPINKDEIEKPEFITELNRIVHSVDDFSSISSIISVLKPYGLRTDIMKDWEKYKLPPLNNVKDKDDDIRVLTARGINYVSKNYPFPQIGKAFRNYKVFVPYAWGNWDEKRGLGGAYSDIVVGKPYDTCIETYLECGSFKTKEEAYKLAKYLMTKFARALLYVNKYSQHSTTAFGSIPMQHFSEGWWNLSIKEIDNKLFEKYCIPKKIEELVELNIQTKDESNIVEM